MLRILILMTTFLSIFSFFWVNKAWAEDQYFVVTAYYSPLPDQEYYLKWNYEAEMRLNGRGIAGASWKGVFEWMLAAPKDYAFGTKIYLEWLGIGSVEDRGWAIVNAGNRWYEHDRIDVWMGYGDEWLARALYWGKRKVKWEFAPSSSPTTIDVHTISAPDYALKWAQKANITQKIIKKPVQKKQAFFDMPLTTAASKNEFQNILKKLGYYDGEITDDNEAIIDLVYHYQVEKWILDSPYTPWAGWFGPTTRTTLKNEYELYQVEIALQKEREILKQNLEKSSYEQAVDMMSIIGQPKFWDISPQVRALQQQLAEFGYFEHKDTAIFGEKTKESILSYQIEKNILNSADEVWAGIFGPKTREQLKKDLQQKIFTTLVSEEPKLANAQDSLQNI